MVMLSSTLRGRVLKFHSEALDPNTLLVVRLTGSEAISAPYEYQIELISQKADLDSQKLLENRCSLGIKQGIWIAEGKRGIQTLHFHGVLETFEQLEKQDDWVAYRAVLVPRFSRLGLNVRSAVYMDRSVPEIAQEVLEGAGFTTEDFEFRTEAREYPKREYVVQYQESDLRFLSRLLEHEGIFYFFVHGDEREKIVFADSAAAYPRIVGDGVLPYRVSGMVGDAQGANWFDEETAQTWVYRHRIAPKDVVLKDYNYRTPSVDLKVSAEVNSAGVGTVYEYGDHYKDTDEGGVLAQIRAEEHKCRERTFQGGSDCRSLRAGATFALQEHYRPEFNVSYVVTRVVHKAEQSLPLGTSPLVQVQYRNEFECIPADVVFRPKRTTPKPKIPGTMNAKIDAAGDGTYAELDEQGRYRVQLPFDLSGLGSGKASRPMRMAQPYAGATYGMHFPLHKGTEVVLTHIDGDPDRPLISAAVPNPETVSPVLDTNCAQGMVKSAANNALLFDDTKDGERILIRAQRNLETRVANNSHELVGVDRHVIVERDQIERIKNDLHQKIDRDAVQEVGGARHVTLGSHDILDVAGKSSITIAGDANAVFKSHWSTEVAGFHSIQADNLVVDCASGITFRCGDSSIVLDASGVTVAGTTLTLDGTTTKINSGSGSSPSSVIAGECKVPTPPLDAAEPGDLSIGAATKWQCTTSVPVGGGTVGTEDSWIEIELLDNEGNPVPEEMYEVELSDGMIVRGRLDEEGWARVEGVTQGDSKVRFPRLDQDSWDRS